MVATLERKLDMKHLRRIGLMLLLVLVISAALSAQDSSVLLEKAVYTEETLGNINEAISIYQQVIAATDSSRTTAAMAIYRLGMCYQKIGRAADAQAAFSKLAKQYPEQQALISKIPGSPSKGLQFKRVPWVDGEVLQFCEKPDNTGRGSEAALTAEYIVESVQLNGKAAWKLRCLKLVPVPRPIGNAARRFQFSTVYMDFANLMPISSNVKLPMVWLEYLATTYINNYSPGLVDQSGLHQSGGGADKKRLALDREVYDYNQMEMIIRCLPLREGHHYVIPVAFQNGPEDVQISVPAHESITVPAGTFDCYKVIANAPEQVAVYWISTDANAYIVKFDQGDFRTRELKTIKKIEHTKPTNFEDRELGIRISTPAQWYVSHAWSAPAIRLIEPEAEVDGKLEVLSEQEGNKASELSTLLDGPSSSAATITMRNLYDPSIDIYRQKQQAYQELLEKVKPAHPDAMSLKAELEQMDKEIKWNKIGIPDFVIRPESRATTTLSGQPTISYLADPRIGIESRPAVAYVFHFTKSNKVYQLVFKLRAKEFDSMKPTLDSIAKSIVVQ